MRVICCLLLLCATQVHAELVQEGTAVRDTVTGLIWFRPILTQGQDYRDALATNSWLGYRFATRREIDALAKRYIGSAEGVYSGGQDFLQTMRVIALLGATYETLGSDTEPVKFATMGYYNDGSIDDGVGFAEFSVSLFVPNHPSDPVYPDLFVSRWVTLDNFLPADTTMQTVGAFLVKRQTP